MKLGVLTVGSDAPGLNAVIRAVVRTAAHRYQSDVVGVVQGFEGLLRPPQFWALAPGDVRGLVRRGGTMLGCNHGDPFDIDGRDRSHEILESIRWLGIDGLIVIGGDGSLVIAERLLAKGAPIVCVPKTVENDLPGTELTFGYATAVDLATEAIDNLQTTGESAHRVMYLEVLGAKTGWIALNSGLAGGADVILIPEIPYDPEAIAAVVRVRKEQRKASTIIVVSEGARAQGAEGAKGQAAAEAMLRVSERLGDSDALVTVLGHLQRGGDPNPQDRVLATSFGAAAVRAAHEGHFGHMVALKGGRPDLVPLGEVVGKLRAIDPQGEHVWTACSLGISFGANGHSVIE